MNDGRDGSPERAARRGGRERQCDRSRGIGDRQRERRPGRGEPADRDLPLAADIDDPGAEAQRDADPSQEIRCRLVGREGGAIERAERAEEQRAIGEDRVLAGKRDQRGQRCRLRRDSIQQCELD